MRRFACWLVAWFLAVPVGIWGWLHQRRIARSGRELNPQELTDASALGVRNPADIRLFAVPRVPNPFDKMSGMVEKLTGYSIFNPAGMTLGYGVFTISELAHNRALLAHEFVHVAQYERLGIFGFMRRYIFQCLADGYLNAPLEIEARQLSALLVPPGPRDV